MSFETFSCVTVTGTYFLPDSSTIGLQITVAPVGMPVILALISFWSSVETTVPALGSTEIGTALSSTLPKVNSASLPFKPALASTKVSNALFTSSCVASVLSNISLAFTNAVSYACFFVLSFSLV